jgi:hypothetical protein
MEITYAIVGTAGRKEDGKKLSRQHFEAMMLIASGLLEQINESNYPISHLVSGGAAWADHVAVRLFLDKKAPHLRLFLPDLWDNGSYHDTGEKDPYKNPGGTANYYHGLFQKATGINSLSDIQIAQAHGAELIDRNRQGKPLGFHARNALVAKSDFILACTFGDKNMLKDGGTADTIRKYLERVRKEGIFDKSFHYDLTTRQIYEGAQAPPENKDKEEMVKLAKRLGIRGKPIGMHFFPPSP